MIKKIMCLSLCSISILAGQSDLEELKRQTKELIQKVKILESNTLEDEHNTHNTYTPELAFILNMSAVSRDVTNSEYANAVTPGFIGAGENEVLFNPQKGFNFNYAEIALHSDVNPYFDASVLLHLQTDVFEIEEAYVRTRQLPYSLSLKAGKFRSNFGYINEQHQHLWNFDEVPLIYNAFFGPGSLNDAGVQLQWVVPTDSYLMFGLETMQGVNAKSFGDTQASIMYISYLKSRVDISQTLSMLGGVSYVNGKTDTNEKSTIYGVDLRVEQKLTNESVLTWQSEYLQRDKAGENRAGLYTELVYKYNNRYSTGLRYDLLIENSSEQSEKYTCMLEYKAFTNSRLRLEYSNDKSKVVNTEKRAINTVIFSLNIEVGSHSGHSH